MCGFIGFVAPHGHSPQITPAQLTTLRDTMTYRGPDDAGLLIDRSIAFAHRRLAIRDLDSPPQPWRSPDGRYVLIYNGELYNDHELRAKINRAGLTQKTSCDTELLLQAWILWQEHALPLLRGMFAFAIYDFQTQKLFAARDRFGIKPLYFAHHAQQLIVSSTLKAITSSPGFSTQPNLHAISHYLTTLRATLGDQTLFERVFQLRPGHLLTWQNGHTHIERYHDFDLQQSSPTPASLDDLADDLAGHLHDSITQHMVSDVPVGAFLSGGVDSSLMAALLQQSHPQTLVTRSVGCLDPGQSPAPESDLAYAQIVADSLHCQHANIAVSADQYWNSMHWMIDQLHTPLTTPSDVLIYHLARDMKQSVGVALGGEGADELLCGYDVQHWSGHDYDRLRQLQAGHWPFPTHAEDEFLLDFQQHYGRSQPRTLIDFYFQQNSLIPLAVQRMFWKPERLLEVQSAGIARDFYHALLSPHQDAPSSVQIKHLLLHTNLEALLARLDNSTMLASLEARVPYADHQLATATARYPLNQLIQLKPHANSPWKTAATLFQQGDILSKRPLRALAARSLPETFAQRPKASFPTNIQSWLTENWQDQCCDLIRSSVLLQEICTPNHLDQILQLQGATAIYRWPLLNLALWDRAVFS